MKKKCSEKGKNSISSSKWVRDFLNKKMASNGKINIAMVAVIFIFGGSLIASTPTIINYFSALPSLAFDSQEESGYTDEIIAHYSSEASIDSNKLVRVLRKGLSSSRDRIYLHDLTKNKHYLTEIYVAPYFLTNITKPKIFGNKIIWREATPSLLDIIFGWVGHASIMMYDISTDMLTEIVSDKKVNNFDLYDDKLVYVERTDIDPSRNIYLNKLILQNLQSGEEDLVASWDDGYVMYDPEIYKDNIIWQEIKSIPSDVSGERYHRGEPRNFYMSISTGQIKNIYSQSIDDPYDCYKGLHISGNKVICATPSNIYMSDITNGQETIISPNSPKGLITSALISEDQIAWSAYYTKERKTIISSYDIKNKKQIEVLSDPKGSRKTEYGSATLLDMQGDYMVYTGGTGLYSQLGLIKALPKCSSSLSYPQDNTKFNFNDIVFGWKSVNLFSSPIKYYEIIYWNGDKQIGKYNIGLNTEHKLFSDDIEIKYNDGPWEWAVKATFENGVSCTTDSRKINKKTGPNIITPENGVNVSLNTKFDWEDIPGARLYILKIKRGKISLTSENCRAKYCYIPLVGNGNISEFTMTNRLYNTLESGQTYEYAIAATNIRDKNGGFNLSVTDNRLPKLSYGGTKTFTVK